MNRRIRKKINKRYGIKKYSVYKIVSYPLKIDFKPFIKDLTSSVSKSCGIPIEFLEWEIIYLVTYY